MPVGSRRHVPATGEALRRLAARARPASVMPCFALLPARRRHRLGTVTRGQDEWRPCRFPPPRSCNPRSHQCGTAFSLGPPFSVTVSSDLRNISKADFHGVAFQVEHFQSKFPFNPFAAPACNISGLKDAVTCLQTYVLVL